MSANQTLDELQTQVQIQDNFKCDGCRTKIKVEEDRLICSNQDCRKLYHRSCTPFATRVPSPEEQELWICPECLCSRKRGGDNSKTPVGTPRNMNVTLRKVERTKISDPEVVGQDPIIECKTEIQKLRMEIVELSNQLAKAILRLDKCNENLEKHASSVVLNEARIVALEQRDSKIPTPDNTQAPSVAPIEPKRLFNEVAKRNAIVTVPVPALECAARTSSSATNNSDSRPSRRSSGSASTHDDLSQDVQRKLPVSDEWTEVRGKKPRRLASLECKAGPSVTSLRAVERRKHLHLWNMESGLDEIRDYLRSLCPNGTCTVEELKPKGDYKSYKIGVPDIYYDKCFSVDIWPDNARVKPWVPFRKASVAKPPT